MATPANNRKVGTLYASLTPLERARLLARFFREDNQRELDRLRDTIPHATAGAAYNTAIRILRQLHGATMPMLLYVKTGIDLDLWRLLHCYDLAADRQRARMRCHDLWELLGYPVTANEYHTLLEIERSQPMSLDDYAGFIADTFDADWPGELHPAIATWLRDVPGETPDDEALRQVRALLDAAIERGELPTPEQTNDGPALSWGVLHDWCEQTTPESYRPYPPAFHVPAVELLWCDSAEWDIRPDQEAAVVKARRGALLTTFTGTLDDGGTIDADELAKLTLEPPSTFEEQERAAEAVSELAPWSIRCVRDDIRTVAQGHAIRRAEVRAYVEAIDRLQRYEFGGEDPLDPLMRALITDTQATEERFEEAWAAVTAATTPWALDEDQGWPPPFEDEAYLERLRPDVERHLRGDWGP
jgi:hypothetical protein